MKVLFFPLLLLIPMYGCSHMGMTPTNAAALAQGEKVTVNLNRSPDALYDTLTEIKSINNEEDFYLREEYCYKKHTYSQAKYQSCLYNNTKVGRPSRYVKRDPVIIMPEARPVETKWFNFK